MKFRKKNAFERNLETFVSITVFNFKRKYSLTEIHFTNMYSDIFVYHQCISKYFMTIILKIIIYLRFLYILKLRILLSFQ